MKKLIAKIHVLLLTLMVGLIASSSAFATATIVIQNNDAPGVGFNDPTAAAPVGGNPGTTVGQQRLNAFQFAANIWGATLNSNITITVRASWEPLECEATTGVLGAAGSIGMQRDFPGAPFAGTWYSTAQANSLANSDLNIGTPEISARFNINIGNSGCLHNNQLVLRIRYRSSPWPHQSGRRATSRAFPRLRVPDFYRRGDRCAIPWISHCLR